MEGYVQTVSLEMSHAELVFDLKANVWSCDLW